MEKKIKIELGMQYQKGVKKITQASPIKVSINYRSSFDSVLLLESAISSVRERHFTHYAKAHNICGRFLVFIQAKVINTNTNHDLRLFSFQLYI